MCERVCFNIRCLFQPVFCVFQCRFHYASVCFQLLQNKTIKLSLVENLESLISVAFSQSYVLLCRQSSVIAVSVSFAMDGHQRIQKQSLVVLHPIFYQSTKYIVEFYIGRAFGKVSDALPVELGHFFHCRLCF